MIRSGWLGGMSVEIALTVKRGVTTHPECGQHHFIRSALDCKNGEEDAERCTRQASRRTVLILPWLLTVDVM